MTSGVLRHPQLTQYAPDTQHAIVVLAGAVAGAGYLFMKGVSGAEDALETYLFLILALALWFAILRASLDYGRVLASGYSLYAAAAINATIVWRACGMKPAHTWMLHAMGIADEKGLFFHSKDEWLSAMSCERRMELPSLTEQARLTNKYGAAPVGGWHPRASMNPPELAALWKSYKEGSLLGQHASLLSVLRHVSVLMAAVALVAIGVKTALWIRTCLGAG